MDQASLTKALQVLGKYLQDQELHYEVVAIGGGGLLLLGLIIRPTKDLDLVALVENDCFISARFLPAPLAEAIHEVGKAYKLGTDWVNSGPVDLYDMGLPDGFKERMVTFFYGGLTLHLADRFDQICFKLYATVDQEPGSKHYVDLKNLNPTKSKLEKAAVWCKTHDPSEGFSSILAEVLTVLGG